MIFARYYGPEDRANLEASLANVDGLSVRELDYYLEQYGEQITELRRYLRVQVTPAELRAFVGDFPREPHHKLLFLPKYVVRRLVPGLLDAIPLLEDLPEGARISFDVLGLLPRGHAGELKVLEAALFEDMAIHVNRALDLAVQSDRRARSEERNLTVQAKIPAKQAAAARRAAITSAFFTLEAYLNSLAFDHVILHQSDLTPKQLITLTEWDPSGNDGKGRERFVSLREKLLQYPRIILRREHPPLDETNCEALRTVLIRAKDLRDAVVHASPKPPPHSDLSDKELKFIAIDLPAVLSVVDAVVELIATLEETVRGSRKRLFWLEGRAADGRFPDTVFS